MKKPSLEETVRGLLSEQNEVKKAWDKEKKPHVDIGGSAHDPSSPNKSHVKEEEINELHGKGKLPPMKAHYEKKGEEAGKSAEKISTGKRFAKGKDAVRQVLSKFATKQDMEAKAKRAGALIRKLDEDEIEEDLDTGHAKQGLGARHNPRKTAFKNDLHRASRNWGGNQMRRPSTYAESFLPEAKQVAMKKVNEKKGQERAGKTDTGQSPDPVEFQPQKPELTTNH